MERNKDLSKLICYWRDQFDKWEREYRLYGPQGEIEKHQTGLLKKDLNGLRSRISKLDHLQEQLDATIQDLEDYRQRVLEQSNQRMNQFHIHQYE